MSDIDYSTATVGEIWKDFETKVLRVVGEVDDAERREILATMEAVFYAGVIATHKTMMMSVQRLGVDGAAARMVVFKEEAYARTKQLSDERT